MYSRYLSYRSQKISYQLFTVSRLFPRLFLFQILFIFSTSSSYADVFEDALNALGDGKYDKAYNLWKPLAEKGNTAAQYYIGVMFANGQGVTRDYIQAYAWYSIAAEEQDFAEENREDIEKLMSQIQLIKAKKLALLFNKMYVTP